MFDRGLPVVAGHLARVMKGTNSSNPFPSAEKNGEWLTMSEAAAKLGVTNHRIRRLIKDRVLAAEQVVPGAPYQIRASNLQDERVIAAIGRKGRPWRVDLENQIPMFPDT